MSLSVYQNPLRVRNAVVSAGRRPLVLTWDDGHAIPSSAWSSSAREKVQVPSLVGDRESIAIRRRIAERQTKEVNREEATAVAEEETEEDTVVGRRSVLVRRLVAPRRGRRIRVDPPAA